MNATEAFKAGRLAEAIDAQLAEVKKHAADPGKRVFLFELLLFSGDLDRAAKQGQLINHRDLERDAVSSEYQRLVEAEKLRRKVLAGEAQPLSYGEAPPSFAPRLEALRLIRDGKRGEAAALLAKQPDEPVKGTLNGQPFEMLRDGDDVLAPILEVMTARGYFWVPFGQIRRVATNPPKYPRDLFWLPATLELDEASGAVYLPVLYAGSHEHTDDSMKLGRSTDWVGGEGEPIRGVGHKTLFAGEEAVGMADLRELVIDAPAN